MVVLANNHDAFTIEPSLGSAQQHISIGFAFNVKELTVHFIPFKKLHGPQMCIF